MRTLTVITAALLFACTSPESPATYDSPEGQWIFSFDLNGDTFQQLVSIDSLMCFTFINDTEAITTDAATFIGDTAYVRMPIYDTYLRLAFLSPSYIEGAWFNPSKSSNYTVDVIGTRKTKAEQSSGATPISHRYTAQFSPGTPGEYPAEAQFTLTGNRLAGTFRTETGDYRFLSGTVDGSNWQLGCFDGSHLFLFTITVEGDTLHGTFKSGTHWQEAFIAYRADDSPLRDPYEITYVSNPQPLQINALNTDFELISIAQADLVGKVHVLQIMGSWCPNCLDESRYLTELQAQFSHDELVVLGFAFERSDDPAVNLERIRRYAKEINVNYPIYLAGKASKATAAEVFPMLNDISSFPTTLVLDKAGNISFVHTGFNGPGTGEVYENFKQRFKQQLIALLQEGAVAEH